jgi:nucleotide-binding universal stress UspA family protein
MLHDSHGLIIGIPGNKAKITITSTVATLEGPENILLMQKKILIAVDDSHPSRQAVDYAGRMAAVIPKLGACLFHVQPPISQFLLDEAQRKADAQAELKKIALSNDAAGRRLLASCREVLVRSGMQEEGIDLVTQPRSQGVAKDILDYAQNGLFDAILIGRRGVSFLQQVFMGSVSAHVIENSPVIPIWLVDGDVTSTQIIAAVDGSESALRAVDHMAFMLSGNPDARICFFHVTPRLRDYCEINFNTASADGADALIAEGDQRCMNDFFAAALAKLRDAGFHENQIQTQTETTLTSIGETILKVARERGCGTVVLGRRGIGRSFFGGKVSYTVSQKLNETALWLVP